MWIVAPMHIDKKARFVQFKGEEYVHKIKTHNKVCNNRIYGRLCLSMPRFLDERLKFLLQSRFEYEKAMCTLGKGMHKLLLITLGSKTSMLSDFFD